MNTAKSLSLTIEAIDDLNRIILLQELLAIANEEMDCQREISHERVKLLLDIYSQEALPLLSKIKKDLYQLKQDFDLKN